ncbi:Ig-like domain-containing protein [Rhodothermus marinus]|uniref:Ig-like domain-containing protein n=1 Tax=Rhodothermus marinus TaxID=29549 RepID=UPI0002E23EA7|nr:Ig-like domain-containing protein [Rhodothermus marinus]
MRRIFFLLVAGVLLWAGCDQATTEETAGIVTLTGQVLDAETNDPIVGALVQLQPQGLITETDSVGRYRFEVTIDSTMELTVSATKTGYSSASLPVLAVPDRTIEVPVLRLTRTATEEPVSGEAANILLLSQSDQAIGVRESGSKETAELVFQVSDSMGRPVVLDHAVRVRFRFGVQPGGGEYLFPEEAQTDNSGRVRVHVASGTKAGVVQVVAEANVNGRTIRSQPVSLAIHGGLPDQNFFTLAPAQYNFPGWVAYGLENTISVIVGDQYGNPVRPGTAVYFTTTHGVITGSVLTGANGQGSVTLYSANPLPPDGIAIITATTADRNQQPVTRSIPVVFSGPPNVYLCMLDDQGNCLQQPTVAALGQSYLLLLTDHLGNPLAPGTKLTIEAQGTKVKAVGSVDVELGDTGFRVLGAETTYDDVLRGPGITEFFFRIVEDQTLDEGGTPTVEAVVIKVDGPNGKLTWTFGPESGSAKVLSEEGEIQIEGNRLKAFIPLN